MPVVGVGRDLLFQALGKEYTDDEFNDLCFEYGIELDDVTTEKKMLQKEHQDKASSGPQPMEEDGEDEVIYRIDIPANRYDMMCLEGISRALNIFTGRAKCASYNYRLADMTGKRLQRMVVKPETTLVRPFVVCAILRGVTLDKRRYASFIDLQDKLHQNLCRQRSLVAIGTHDLSTLQGPFTYEALPPGDIEFVPLKQTKSFKASELLEYYQQNDSKLRRYVPIIQKSLVYPVLYDSKRTLLSLPPIINSSHSQISVDTKDIFIECTATDLAKAKIVLNTLCTMFSEYCEVPYEVEPVEVVDAFGKSHVYPDLAAQQREVSVSYVNDCLGLGLGAGEVASLLSRMALDASPAADGRSVTVQIPPTRTDVLHDADVMEDVAIAYGYNNMPRLMPEISTSGRELPLMQLTEALRGEIKDYTESLTWALCSRAENFGHLNQPDDGLSAVSIGNPATAEFEVCRTTLLPALLKTLAANKDAPLPLKLFEVSDVILVDPASETGCRNERRLAAVHCATETKFEVIQGLLNRVMEVLGVPLEGPLADLVRKEDRVGKEGQGGYSWQASDSPTFFPGRHADVLYKGTKVGEFGIVHPTVLANFDIPNTVTALELNIEPFCFDSTYKNLPTHAS